MSLGNNSYNKASGGKKNDYSPTTYSTVKFNNYDSTIDTSSLSFAYWKGMMKIIVTPIKKGSDGSASFDKDNATEVYLTPTRANLFYNYLKMFRENPSGFINVGIPTGNTIIYVTTGVDEFQATDGNSLYFVVKGVDDSGAVVSEIAYQFKTTPDANNFGIIDYNGGTSFTKNYDFCKYLEFDIFMKTIKQYIDSISGAIAATVVDATRYSFNSVIGKLVTIQQNLGIDTGNGFKRQANKSYFYNNGNEDTSGADGGSSGKVEELDNYGELIDEMNG